MRLNPTPEQSKAVDKLAAQHHGLLWSKAGTGKTLVACRTIRARGYRTSIVVAPPIALTMWATEINCETYDDRATVVLIRKAGDHKQLADVDRTLPLVIITTYSMAAKPEVLGALTFEARQQKTALILDEAHYCKTHSAQRSQAMLQAPVLRRIPKRRITGKEEDRGVYVEVTDPDVEPGLGYYCAYVMQLTGTPMTRYPDDYYMQLALVREDVLKEYGVNSYNKWVQAFCTQKDAQFGNRRQRVISGAKNEDVLNQLLHECGIVRHTADDLPDVTYRTIGVPAPKGLEKIKPVNDVAQAIKDEPAYAKVYHDVGVGKVPALVEYLKSGNVEYPVLIGFWHKDFARAFLKDYGPSGVEVVDGSVPHEQRDLIRDEFNSGELPILLGQMSAMGVSWNLQEKCRHVVVAEQTPSPGVLDQFVARVARKGQQGHVQVDLIVAETWLDEAIVEIRKTKRAITERTEKEIGQ